MRDGRNVCPAILAVTSLWTFVARPAAVEQSVHSPSCTDSYLLALEKRIIDSHLPRAGTAWRYKATYRKLPALRLNTG
jgi:hypothetical protein